MTKEKYEKISERVLSYKHGLTVLKAASKITTVIGFGSYVLLAAVLILNKDVRIIRCTFVPAATFIAATVIRAAINAPRPYESLGITPLIPKSTKGKSFPSRHVVSMAAVAAAWYYINVPAGIFLWTVTVAVCVIRPVSGVHFPRDTAAGALFSAVCAAVGYYLI